jgi:hypothetical protein
MKISAKKFVGYFLVALVLVFTVLGVLGIWEVIDMTYVMKKLFFSLMIVFIASAVMLFIFTVIIKEDEKP